MTTNSDATPWYRNGMVWLVIGIPALTVVGCLLTIFLAVGSPDGLVSDYDVRTDTRAEGG